MVLSTCDLVRCEGLGRLIRLSLGHSGGVALLVNADVADTKPNRELKKKNCKGCWGATDEACCLAHAILRITRMGKTTMTSNNVHSYVCFCYIRTDQQPLCGTGIHP
jgi:hypothetical protein